MTPEEAIKILEKKKEYSERITDNFLSHSRGEIKDANETIEMCDMAISALEEIQQYREIGSVEECREAVEKQKPKKPVLRNDNGKLRKSCPVCGCFFSPLSRSCPKCGQAILQENKDD